YAGSATVLPYSLRLRSRICGTLLLRPADGDQTLAVQLAVACTCIQSKFFSRPRLSQPSLSQIDHHSSYSGRANVARSRPQRSWLLSGSQSRAMAQAWVDQLVPPRLRRAA